LQGSCKAGAVPKRRIDSASPAVVTFKYVPVVAMLVWPSMSLTWCSGQPASRSRDTASCRSSSASRVAQT
jgi:hypothetical protein